VKPYEPAFQAGDRVRIADREKLEAFRRNWKHHHPLQPEQLAHAEMVATVASVGIYHGGDVIYQLVEATGTWHEDCLERRE
jgi:hypothetical protein